MIIHHSEPEYLLILIFIHIKEVAHQIFNDINGAEIMESTFKQYKDSSRKVLERKNKASTQEETTSEE